MIIYLDILFFVNFFMDFFIISLATRFITVRFSLIRTVLSSLLGAVYACISLVIPFLNFILIKFLAFGIMTYIAYGYGSFIGLIKNTMGLLMCFFICGGTCFSILFIFGTTMEEMVYKFPFFVLFSSVMLAGFIVLIQSKKIKASRAKSFAEIEIYKDGKKYNLRALFDSGNVATDNISGLPLIICENIFGFMAVREEFIKTASGFGRVKVFIPDKVRVTYMGESYTGKDLAIGITSEKLSFDNSFNALIGGICFDRLFKEAKKTFSLSHRGRDFLHRDGRAFASAPDFRGRRGDDKKIFKGR